MMDYQYTDHTLGKFSAAMEAHGWQPRRDRFGQVIEWSNIWRTVTNKAAFDYWWMSGRVPEEMI
jgi:hypothetical protein